MAEVRMPKMGDGMEEGTINVWLKKEGDLVKAGDIIAEVETDKANVEISAYDSGILSKILVPVGQTVPVGTVIAYIGDGNDAEVTGTPATTTGSSQAPAPATPDGAARPAHPPSSTPAGTGERVKASPLARRMAQELGIDLRQVTGSGQGGVIHKRDIEAFQRQPGKVLPAVETASTTGPVTPAVATAPPDAGPTGQDIKPTRMREAIARRTVQSKQNVPHFYVSMLIEMDRALALLKELNADAGDGNKITVNDIIVKACAVALGRVPEVNATWTPEGVIRRYAEVHIGIAVGIEDGLVVPVVRNCHQKTLRQISAEAKALIQKARNNQLKPEEFSGGTFSVSNLGMMGVDEFTAIINPPEAAILAVGGITRDAVVDANDQIVVKSRMKVTLSADHRLLDGVVAARFLQEVKKALETPFSLLS
ncbi:MAG: dihydrolipoamide acetyltransferase family protein [Chloroherpetonaceae bacterium]|nr:2-oxo acid dehydrogenase subunit E2 [Chthonomonadaceae bacterium]MDW8206856.1 dihydrolipoamide acetyltransferase family protein [Chloroherpetonaceae bacterium]